MAEKSEQIAFRLTAETKKALVRAAKAEDRTVANLINHAVAVWLRENGYLKK